MPMMDDGKLLRFFAPNRNGAKTDERTEGISEGSNWRFALGLKVVKHLVPPSVYSAKVELRLSMFESSSMYRRHRGLADKV